MVLDEPATRWRRRSSHARPSSPASAPGVPRLRWSRSCPVDYYGNEVPLQQIAGFTVPEARLLVISPYDKSAIGRHREGDPEQPTRAVAQQRRPGHPAQLPAADRGAPQGAGAGGARHGRGGTGQHPPRPAGRPPRSRGAREGRRHLGRRPQPGPRRSSTSSRRSTRPTSTRRSSQGAGAARGVSPGAAAGPRPPHGPGHGGFATTWAGTVRMVGAPDVAPPSSSPARCEVHRGRVRRKEDDVTDRDDRREGATARIPPRASALGADEAAEALERDDIRHRFAEGQPRFGDRPAAPPARGPGVRRCASHSGRTTTPIDRATGLSSVAAADGCFPSCRTGPARPQRRSRT